jgi:hypothetical protein
MKGGEKMTIKLGKKVKDKITGFEGIVTGVASYLYGCDQYLVTPPAKDGAKVDAYWFDEGRLEVIGQGILPEEVQTDKPGGPNVDCPRDKF